MPRRPKLKLRVDEDELTIGEGQSSFLGKLIAGTRGEIKVRTPFGERKIHNVKNTRGKVLRDDKHPENVGKTEKPK